MTTRVTLRAPIESDKRDRLAAGRDPEIRRAYGGSYCGERDSPRMAFGDADAEQWYRAIAAEPYGWVIDVGGRCVGSARLHTVDTQFRRARFAIGLFLRDDLLRGYGTEATRLALKQAFETLGLHRVDLRVLGFNERAIRCYSKCGFVREGIEREVLLLDGKWQDDVIMSILEDEYRAAAPGWEGQT